MVRRNRTWHIEYEEGVLSIDRPAWREEKARRMISNYKEVSDDLKSITAKTSQVLDELGIPKGIRGIYHAFTKKLFKELSGVTNDKLRVNIAKGVVEYYATTHGADKKILVILAERVYGIKVTGA